jgi:tRNA U34 5-carboxymethylaminomethyl modifying enzyme MnmG/GidA
LKPDIVNEYLASVCTSEVDSRKRISDLVSRPQVKLNDILDLVPRGTILKYSEFNFDAVFVDPTTSLLKEEVAYSDTLSYESYESLSGKLNPEYSESSYKDALYVLKSNTEYPVSMLDKEQLDANIISNYKRDVIDSCEIGIKYKGYIQREQQMADKIMRLENLIIPEGFDFDRVESLSIECRQKLKRYSPRTIAQASRISGVSPADISVLLVYFGR